MIGFVIACVVLTLVTVAALVWPLLRRGETSNSTSTSELSVRVLREQLGDLERERKEGLLDAEVLAEEQRELERRALEDGVTSQAVSAPVAGRKPGLAAIVVLAVPLVAVILYLVLGTPDAMNPQSGASVESAHSVNPQQMQDLATKLADRLRENPDDGEGWLMLARSYAVMSRYPDSATAYERATALLPPSADLLADHADVMAMAQGRTLLGKPETLVAQALRIDPTHAKSLALSGSVAFERGDFSRAADEWRKILVQLPPDSSMVASIQSSIADAESRIGAGAPRGMMGQAPVAQATPPASNAKTKPAGKASVAGRVTIAPELQANLPANATLYVFARPADGSRMPLAMRRLDSVKFPVEFTLDESMAMAPNASLSNATKVVVGARVSLNGDAIGKPGDLEGFSGTVDVGASDIKVVVGAVRK